MCGRSYRAGKVRRLQGNANEGDHRRGERQPFASGTRSSLCGMLIAGIMPCPPPFMTTAATEGENTLLHILNFCRRPSVKAFSTKGFLIMSVTCTFRWRHHYSLHWSITILHASCSACMCRVDVSRNEPAVQSAAMLEYTIFHSGTISYYMLPTYTISKYGRTD